MKCKKELMKWRKQLKDGLQRSH